MLCSYKEKENLLCRKKEKRKQKRQLNQIRSKTIISLERLNNSDCQNAVTIKSFQLDALSILFHILLLFVYSVLRLQLRISFSLFSVVILISFTFFWTAHFIGFTFHRQYLSIKLFLLFVLYHRLNFF